MSSTSEQRQKLQATIMTLADRIQSYEERAGRVNESNTIRALITPLVSALGWPIDDLDEVQSEYRHRRSDNPVDYALFIDGVPSLFIEAKALGEKLDDRRWIVQTLNYANACAVEWAALTNGEEWRVYNVHAKAEAEDKMFFSARITSDDTLDTTRRLEMLARHNMSPTRALDQLWREASIDSEMRRIIEGLADNTAVVRAMSQSSDKLSEVDVREALRRLKLRANWRSNDDMFPSDLSLDNALMLTESDLDLSDVKIPAHRNVQGSNTTSKRKKTSRIRMREVMEAGELQVGQRLRIRGFVGSDATILDSSHVDFQGRKLRFNEWGQTVTGWTAIRIYTHAETEDGLLLDDLRRRVEANRK